MKFKRMLLNKKDIIAHAKFALGGACPLKRSIIVKHLGAFG